MSPSTIWPSHRTGRPSWQDMDVAYEAILDYFAPVAPDEYVPIDERRPAVKHALAGTALHRRLTAARIARAQADIWTAEELYEAIRLWQWAYRAAAHSARQGNLTSQAFDDHITVTEPLSGIGVKFTPHRREISSDGGTKDLPTVLQGHITGNHFGRAEKFVGAGIGRWVYLHGAQQVLPDLRWPTLNTTLRPGSGSPHVRAWLHAQQPHRWAPVHQMPAHASCATCARATPRETEAAWLELDADARPRDHRLIRLPRPADRGARGKKFSF